MITTATKKELYAQQTGKVFCNLLTISHSSWVNSLRFIDNTEGITISGNQYEARGFDFTPPEPASEDATASVSLDDTDRLLAEKLQLLSSMPEVSISCIRYDDPTVTVDGPFTFNMVEFKKNSQNGKVELSLERISRLNYTASAKIYSNSVFPGLFG